MQSPKPLIAAWLIILVLALAGSAQAKLDRKALARHLYEVLRYEGVFKNSFYQSYLSYFTGFEHSRMQEGKKANPKKQIVAASQASTEVFFEEYGSKIKEETIAILVKRFSYEELSELMQFYSSPTGQKLQAIMGNLIYDMQNLGQKIDLAHKRRMVEDGEFKKAYTQRVKERIEQKME
jgi:hypothetical protein